MTRRLGLISALALASAITACTGPVGPKGDQGESGTSDPSISAVTPSSAFLGRTVDLTLSGVGTRWTDKVEVTFADPKITVNKVTVASETGLVVNVTVGLDADIAATDVTVSVGVDSTSYKGAFQIKAPLEVTLDQPEGVPQGGIAIVHARMLDTDTPFDPAALQIELGSTDLLVGSPSVTDFIIDFAVQADVLAKTGDVDMMIKDAVDSPARAAFKIAPRAPTKLTGTPATGTIKTENDTALFQLTPADTTLRFVQFKVSSSDGEVVGYALPKSGKYADLQSAFIAQYGFGSTAADPTYVVVADSNGLFGPGPVPASFKLQTTEVVCTGAAEAEGAAGNDTPATANTVAKLPALIDADLDNSPGNGADVDVFAITVAGASDASPKTIHIATGGPARTDPIVELLDANGDPIGEASDDVDYHEDLLIPGIKADGVYYVRVTQSSYFDPAYNKYQLFIEVK